MSPFPGFLFERIQVLQEQVTDRVGRFELQRSTPLGRRPHQHLHALRYLLNDHSPRMPALLHMPYRTVRMGGARVDLVPMVRKGCGYH